jgi:hypothetical protein
VFRGIEGYAASNHNHTTRILSLSDDLPVSIVIVDRAERIDGFLPQLDELSVEGLVMVPDPLGSEPWSSERRGRRAGRHGSLAPGSPTQRRQNASSAVPNS